MSTDSTPELTRLLHRLNSTEEQGIVPSADEAIAMYELSTQLVEALLDGPVPADDVDHEICRHLLVSTRRILTAALHDAEQAAVA